MALERLDKIIASTGRYSRKEVKRLVDSGRVRVDGSIPESSADKYDPDKAVISVDGQTIGYSRYVYYMLNKPKGYICATEDGNLPTVIELLPEHLQRRGLFPVGRLDRDTTGLLLLTDDGNFAHNVISPKKHVSKVYRASLDGPVGAADAAAFKEGIVLGDGMKCLPAELICMDEPSLAQVKVFEGKYHQVKRMFAARGRHVIELHRSSIGALILPSGLLPGQGKELTAEEAQRALGDSAKST